MFTVRKEFKFCYSHQLFEAYTKLCSASIHGHNAKVEVFFNSGKLDKTGMVIDFGEIKNDLKDYFDSYLDHSLFMSHEFPEEYLNLLDKYNERFYILTENPTAEVFAKMIFEYINSLVSFRKKRITLAKVRFWETDSSYAEYYFKVPARDTMLREPLSTEHISPAYSQE